jgi:hypothetical protein
MYRKTGANVHTRREQKNECYTVTKVQKSRELTRGEQTKVGKADREQNSKKKWNT